MITNIKSLSTAEINLISKLASTGKNIFTIKDAEKLLKPKISKTRQFLYILSKKGRIEPLEKGKYLIIPLEAGPEGKWSEDAFIIASHLVNPYAISYWSALSHYDFTEQQPRTIFIQTTARKFQMQKKVLGVDYKFIKIKNNKYFGLTAIWVGDKQISITDKEKTIIDCLNRPDLSGGIIESAKGLKNYFDSEHNLKKLTTYAKKFGSGTVFKRLGFIAEILKLPVDDYLEIWRNNITKGYSKLDTISPAFGKHNSKWNLQINVDTKQLVSWQYS